MVRIPQISRKRFTSDRLVRSAQHPGQELAHEPEIPTVSVAEIAVELEECRAGERLGHLAGVVDSAGVPKQASDPCDLGRLTRPSRTAEETLQTPSLRSRGLPAGVNDHERAFSLDEVAVALLPV